MVRPGFCSTHTMEKELSIITGLAIRAHGDQRRKFEPEPYITHLTRVMNTCREYSQDIALLSAALLHDTLEDTTMTGNEIYTGLVPVLGEVNAGRTLELVKELTDQFTKDKYPKWNRRKRKQKEAERLGKTSADAQTIKYADILDNSLTIVNAGDDFVRTYLFEGRAILNEMKKGNQALRERVIQVVEECISTLQD